jgi:hypothetical protein
MEIQVMAKGISKLSSTIYGNPMNVSETLALTKAAANKYRTIVLVEGISDLLVLDALAKRLDIDLEATRTAMVAIGGATNIRNFVDLLTSHKQKVNICGLCDVGEVHYFQRTLERDDFGSDLTQSDLETLGFYACDADLEDELVRSVGVGGVLEVAEKEGELWAFRIFQTQPAWQGRSEEAQIRRWICSQSTRHMRYMPLLVHAMNLSSIPAPLGGLLAHVSRLS